MPRQDSWDAYVAAMRSHLAANERLQDRLGLYVGSPLREPIVLDEQDWDDWFDLIFTVEQAARTHRLALERHRISRRTLR